MYKMYSKVFVLSVFVSMACVAKYGMALDLGGIETGLGLEGGCAGGVCRGAAASLAIHSRHRLNYMPVASTGVKAPTNLFVESQSAPVNILSRSISSPVSLAHVHVPSPGSFRETSSVDGTHRHVHTVTKPIIQEVREIIAPQRIVRQQVQPVQEEIQTTVARNVGVNGGGVAAAAGGSLLAGNGLVGSGLSGNVFA